MKPKSQLLFDDLQKTVAFLNDTLAQPQNEVELWLTFTEQRNLTVHTYQPQLAETIYLS
jgi:hypothetical protein